MRGGSVTVHGVIRPLPHAAGEKEIVSAHLLLSGLPTPLVCSRLVGKGQL
jgi:hypothetical protein